MIYLAMVLLIRKELQEEELKARYESVRRTPSLVKHAYFARHLDIFLLFRTSIIDFLVLYMLNIALQKKNLVFILYLIQMGDRDLE